MSYQANPDELTRKGLATRERIVAAASALTLQRGIAGATTEEVQRAADVSASQIYHYFSDKKSLIRAVIDHQTSGILGFQQPDSGSLDSLEAFTAWRNRVVAVQQQPPGRGGCPLGTLAGELNDDWADARLALADSFGRWEDLFRRGLHAMYQRGELRSPADADRMAMALLAATQGGLLLTQVRGNTQALEAVLDTVLAQLAVLIEESRRTGS